MKIEGSYEKGAAASFVPVNGWKMYFHVAILLGKNRLKSLPQLPSSMHSFNSSCLPVGFIDRAVFTLYAVPAAQRRR